MEEILASIRRIISEDSDQKAQGPAQAAAVAEEEAAPPPFTQAHTEPVAHAAEPEPDEIMELTEVIDEEPEPQPERAPMPSPPPRVVRVHEERVEPVVLRNPEPEENDVMLVEKEEDQAPLVSARAADRTMASFGQLAQSMAVARADGKTLEDIVADMLKPMLKQWLDQHLPETVDRLVREEIERMARRRGGR